MNKTKIKTSLQNYLTEQKKTGRDKTPGYLFTESLLHKITNNEFDGRDRDLARELQKAGFYDLSREIVGKW